MGKGVVGQGDKPIPYKPEHWAARDDVIGKEFASCLMRPCPHPKVIKRFGVGGVANVSVYTCRRCKYHQIQPLFLGVSCVYELEEGVCPGAQN